MSVSEWARVTVRQGTLAEFLLASPLRAAALDLERERRDLPATSTSDNRLASHAISSASALRSSIPGRHQPSRYAAAGVASSPAAARSASSAAAAAAASSMARLSARRRVIS